MDFFGTQSETEADDKCVVHTYALRQLSYQAILDSLFLSISGSINLAYNRLDVASGITETVLLDTHELTFLTDYAFATNNEYGGDFRGSLQTDIVEHGKAAAFGLVDPKIYNQRPLSLKQGLESLLQNITISLMSSPYFQ